MKILTLVVFKKFWLVVKRASFTSSSRVAFVSPAFIFRIK